MPKRSQIMTWTWQTHPQQRQHPRMGFSHSSVRNHDAKVNQTSRPFTVHDTTNRCLYFILRSCDIINPMWLRKHSYSTNPNQLQQSWYIPITSQPQLNNPDRNPFENHPHWAENLPTSPAVAPRFPRPEIAIAARFHMPTLPYEHAIRQWNVL